MATKDTLEIIYYIVIIIVVIAIIIAAIQSINNNSNNTPPKNNSANKNNNRFNNRNNNANNPNANLNDLIPSLDSIPLVPPTPPVELPKYDTFKQNASFKINNKVYQNTDQITYKAFVEISQTDKFHTQFLTSLYKSYEEKEYFYNKARIETLRELAVCGMDDMNGPKAHDTTFERLRRYLNEIEIIIIELQKKKEKLCKEQVKENLHDIIFNQQYGFASLSGREEVKDYLAKQLFAFSKEHSIITSSFSNIQLCGNSGVGKTKLGETIGNIYSKCGIFVRGKFKYITSRQLTSPYVNDAAQLTMNELCSTLEGVLLIDEAYALGSPKEMIHKTNSGIEAIDELVNFTDKFMGRSAIILAGYEKDMEERLMSQNEGLSRRFCNKFVLTDYSPRQLTEILIRRLKISSPKIVLSQTEVDFLYSQISDLSSSNRKVFPKQAGDMLELAGVISKCIVSSVRYHWTDGSKDNIVLLLNGMNEYLRPKGISIDIQ